MPFDIKSLLIFLQSLLHLTNGSIKIIFQNFLGNEIFLNMSPRTILRRFHCKIALHPHRKFKKKIQKKNKNSVLFRLKFYNGSDEISNENW